uniref:Uncharacterized protein n=1 Tax=Trichobilharzia regenti TaxID=157069 RepID=A0AA85KBW1_TRIRE|nr:unnamed protein product [Trichobilharzia regenti]
METDRTERSISREPDSNTQPIATLIENDDEKIFPDMSNLLPKLRELIDENTTVIDNHYPNTQPSEDLNFDE